MVRIVEFAQEWLLTGLMTRSHKIDDGVKAPQSTMDELIDKPDKDFATKESI